MQRACSRGGSSEDKTESVICDILSNQIYVERLAGNNSPRKEWWYQVKSKSRRMFTFYIRNYRIIVWLYFSIEHVMFDN